MFAGRLDAAEQSPADTPSQDTPSKIDQAALDAAITRSISLVEKSAVAYRKQRQCFSCHHQAMPVLMLTEARSHGFAIDEKNLSEQVEHTAAHLRRGKDSYLGGQGQGGKADTAAWALWTLESAGLRPDEVTAAVAQFLLEWQKDSGHWRPGGKRPPTEASSFTTTYVALRALAAFATDEQHDRLTSRREQAIQWLAEEKAQDTEDRVFRLRALHYSDCDQKLQDAAAKELLDRQRDDGGWRQTDEATSDAYATATALVALHDAGCLAADDAAYRRGLDFLLRTQQPDGSWHVVTRSKPIQIYFESGFPHGKDQFISMTATCWATMALLRAHADQ
jgi:N-acyl-D-amino-acid deacylase